MHEKRRHSKYRWALVCNLPESENRMRDFWKQVIGRRLYNIQKKTMIQCFNYIIGEFTNVTEPKRVCRWNAKLLKSKDAFSSFTSFQKWNANYVCS